MPARPPLAILFSVAFLPPCAAAEPLSARIDTLIDVKAAADKVPLSAQADDAEFLRRVWLDFAGRIPTVDEARKFLDDKAADKRAKLVDRLLDGPDYAPRMADRLHLMLIERLGDHGEWTKYLTAAFRANAPWDRMARDMLRADPKADEGTRGAAFFMAKRLENYGQNPVDYSALTRDVGRLFLGKNFQCCECHDHLFVPEYKQAHFQGLHAFFKNTSLVAGSVPKVAEAPTAGPTTFASVFTKKQVTTTPALPGGEMVPVPTFPKGQEYAEPPDRKMNTPGVPKFSALAAVSERLPVATNRDFNRNAANRLWFILLGRGIVHPLDMHHAGNPPSHPELLDLLADEFAAHKFDIRWLLREIANTKAYQRSSLLPPGSEPPHAKYFATAVEKRLSAEQLLACVTTATGTKPTDALKAKFVKAFANQPREPEDEVEASLKGALFVLHDKDVLALLKPTAGSAVERWTKLTDAALADELYLSILTRRPTADEAAAVAVLLKAAGGQRAECVSKLAWALLASAEFRVNH